MTRSSTTLPATRPYQPSAAVTARAACALLLVTMLPVLVLASLAVLLTSPGPVTVRSAGIADGGRVVLLRQFRTTYGDGRPRAVTPVGLFLRRSGIARLPILADVWAGRIGLGDALRR